jgi:hypothetical protein
MDTFRAFNFLGQLSIAEMNEVLAFCIAADEKNNLVCIRVQKANDDNDSDDMCLYGCYEKTAQEVSNYDNAGGMWHYESPKIYIHRLTDGTVDE